MRTAVIAQIRIDSSRLPGKALLPLADATMSHQVLRALKRITAGSYILACPEDSVAALAPVAADCGFELFAGPKDDVLLRYLLAARSAFGGRGAERIVRATGDNPCVSSELANLLLERQSSTNSDYSGYLGMPTGMGVEVLLASALERAGREATDKTEREHVAPYLYRHPEIFNVDRPECPPAWRVPGSLTVDTRDDYLKVKALFESCYRGEPPRDAEILAALAAHVAQAAQSAHSTQESPCGPKAKAEIRP